MKAILLSDLKSYFKSWKSLIFILIVLGFGVFAGSKAQFTLSEKLAYNSPYQIAFITGFLSLTSLFFATILTAQHALREFDYNFQYIYFALPISKKQFLANRFTYLLILTFAFTFVFTVGFFVGREMENSSNLSVRFSLLYYLIPLVLFTLINSFFIVALTSYVAWLTKSKLQVYVGGLLVYVLYMVALIFSGSPFMANQLPQSEQAQWLSAILDPFGLSAYFYQTSLLAVHQRNTEILSLVGMVSANRIGILVISGILLFLAKKTFTIARKSTRRKEEISSPSTANLAPFQFVKTASNKLAKWQSFLTYVKIYTQYVLKSIPLVLLSLGLLFAVGMEMYAEIEKGVRLPQKYATSGLMTSAIIQNFYVFGAFIMVFYANELFWRSRSSNFHFIEESTPNHKQKFGAIAFVLFFFAFFFTTILILEGVLFQVFYGYPKVEWIVYMKVYLFATAPLFLVAAVSLFIQKLIKNKYLALGISMVLVLIMTSSLGKAIIKFPLLKFLHGISFDYSDMNGFGFYENAFMLRLLFGFLAVSLLCFWTYKSTRKTSFWVISSIFFILMVFVGKSVIKGYEFKDKLVSENESADYEKNFRRFQNTPQPIITHVNTQIDLFSSDNRYTIKGDYILENKTDSNIQEVLINLPKGFTISEVKFTHEKQKALITKQYQVVKLNAPLLPKQHVRLNFKMEYQALAVNGHQSFNAIVKNGSFMRISRYFPQIGYESGNEIEDKTTRQKYNLGSITPIKALSLPKNAIDDFIDLNMTVSTETNQTAIGIGELQKSWKENGRNFFQYKAADIPFRFAVSSAHYAVKRESYKGKMFEIYYHPSHSENVDHLMQNAKSTMDYCQTNFGKYPFKTIRFAEVSSFTQGFNATAYPATIYMTEHMAFHCNIKADKQQDVINEMASHEISHLWWGNNQISPDEREGNVMLTETLAMYTELMLLKKTYGKQKVKERVAMHQRIYENERGFMGDSPLIKVTSEQTHISYSKGAVAMYKLSELIGEDKVNTALKGFLEKHKHPNPKPISTDFLSEIYKVTDVRFHKDIAQLFEK